MHQAKFSLTEEQIHFLEQHRTFGFKDRSELVRTALERLRLELERQELEESARLYNEVYAEDPETREWTHAAIQDWPE